VKLLYTDTRRDFPFTILSITWDLSEANSRQYNTESIEELKKKKKKKKNKKKIVASLSSIHLSITELAKLFPMTTKKYIHASKTQQKKKSKKKSKMAQQ
jgi:citrate lyase synthetase